MTCADCGAPGTIDGCSNPNCENWRFADAFDDAVIDTGRVARETDALRNLLEAEGYEVLHGWHGEPGRAAEHRLAVKRYERGDLQVVARWTVRP